MALVIEWRRRAEGQETLLAIDAASGAVVKAWAADTDLLTDFLNDMTGLDDRPGPPTVKANGVDYSERTPPEWGELVMSRSEAGDVLWLDPQLYWEGIVYWFRSRGLDPHPYRAHR